MYIVLKAAHLVVISKKERKYQKAKLISLFSSGILSNRSRMTPILKRF
jgi:hypothetical protein